MKEYYQMELLNREASYNKIFGNKPILQFNDENLMQRLNSHNAQHS